MTKNKKQSGLSLMELLVVMALMVILMGVSIPAAKKIMESFEKTTGARQLINAALANARTMAIRHQAYAGVRFQRDAATGESYMIFIVHHEPAETGGLANGFFAVKGRNPMKLPEETQVGSMPFTIVFSPQGKLTTHNVWTRNKDGLTTDASNDMIFNTSNNVVNNGIGQFVQDSNNRMSRNQFSLDGQTEFINPYTGELVIEYVEK